LVYHKLRQNIKQKKHVVEKQKTALLGDGCREFCTKFSSLNYFFKRRASYDLKAYEFRNWRVFSIIGIFHLLVLVGDVAKP